MEKFVFEKLSVQEGAMVVREGDVGNCAYLMQSGRVLVYNENNGRPVELAYLEAGEIFGEMALASDMPRAASVKALSDVDLIVIDRDILNKKLRRSDATVQAIVHMLIQRMRFSNEMLVKRLGSVNELKKSANKIYDNIAVGLTVEEKTAFEKDVKEKMDDFLHAASKFSDRFSKL